VPTNAPTSAAMSDAMGLIQNIMAGVEASFQQREAQLTQQVAALSVKANRTDHLEERNASLKQSMLKLEEQFQQAKTSWQEQNRQDAIALREAMLNKNSVIAALESTVKQHADRFNAATSTHAKKVEELTVAHTEEKKVLVDSVAEKQEQISTQQLRISDLEAENAALREKNQSCLQHDAGLHGHGDRGPRCQGWCSS